MSPSNFLTRNTPTSVGKTDIKSHRIGGGEKHPHERGEDVVE